MTRLLCLIAGVALCTGLAEASLPTSSLNKTRLGTACAGAANSDLALQCWLNHHPSVANAMVYLNINSQNQTFSQWPVTLQDQMYGYFDTMVSWYDAGWPGTAQPEIFPMPVPLQAPDPDYGSSMSLATGTQVYLGQVGAILAGELTAQFPWSIAGYSSSELNLLLNQSVDYQLQWKPQVSVSGYYWATGFSMSPANPPFVATFFKGNNLLASTPKQTVALLFQWERRLFHFYVESGYNETFAEQYEYFWGPNTPPVPASYVANGTTYTGPNPTPGYTFEHFTYGCWGTTDFMSSMLKMVNIPVQRVALVCGHAVPTFPTAAVGMTHGDDPYDRLGVVTPDASLATPAPADYLVPIGTWDQMFPAGQSGQACLAHVGIQVANIAIQYGSDMLMNAYCQDQASNAPLAEGQVYALLSDYYTVQQLQSMQLWQILEVKQIVTNWCATHPQ